MNKTDRSSKDVLVAWQNQLTSAAQQPLLAQVLVEHGWAVLPRFTQFYAALLALPRRRRRTLQRHLKLSLAAVALVLALGSEPVPAATISVDGISCALADAIAAANTDRISGGCSAGNGADTIVLSPASVHMLTSASADFHGPTGLPVIASEILIESNGATIERDSSGPEFRILAVNALGKLTLKEATISGGSGVRRGGGLFCYAGDVTIANSFISGNSAWSGGGVFNEAPANYNDSSVLTVVSSTISGNAGGGILVQASNYASGNIENTITGSIISDNAGDGVSVPYTSGSVQTTITGSTISSNSRRGVYVHTFDYGRNITTITDTIISGNSAGVVSSSAGRGAHGALSIANSNISTNSGGGVFASASAHGGSDVSITTSTISGNLSARSGAGVSAYTGYSDLLSLAIANSTISGNNASKNGGGIYISGGGGETGGDIDLRVTDSTVTGNSAGEGGGGVYVSAHSPVYIDQVVVNFNRSIISGNTARSGAEAIIDADEPVTFKADNFNLFGYDGNAGVLGFSPGPNDIVPVTGVQIGDILDPVLADNGGTNLTHALVDMSPAIDAVPSTEQGCQGTDQRGISRPRDGNADGVDSCDIGAYELAADEVPFAGFDISRAQVKFMERVSRDELRVEGSFDLGPESDGLDVLYDEIVVTFGGFTETVSSGSLRRVRNSDDDDDDELPGRHYLFRSSQQRIRWLKLSIDNAKGHFSIIARGLDLGDLKLPSAVIVALRIGNDVGRAMIPLNRSGTFIDRGDQEEKE